MLRRCIALRVVHVKIDDVEVPNRVPAIENSKLVRGRLSQMRQRLGMSEEEVDSLLAHSDAVRDGTVDARAPPQVKSDAEGVTAAEPPTWASIVEKRERAGTLYSPKRITDAFPYLGGQGQGMMDFKDDWREEQMIAHMHSPSNHPMSVYSSMQMRRLRRVLAYIVSLIVGYQATVRYYDDMVLEEEVDTRPSNFYLSKDESVRKVRAGTEQVVPVLRHSGHGYTVVWMPTSQATYHMWNNRGGHNYPSQDMTPIDKAAFFDPEAYAVNYSFPGSLASLVDTPGSQVRYQRALKLEQARADRTYRVNQGAASREDIALSDIQ
eukprot:Rhum_TRINITY_DN23055_c0_g1::Rhum_TRINITY_DN23055_c0_g1_i1::g.176996::m.176996